MTDPPEAGTKPLTAFAAAGLAVRDEDALRALRLRTARREITERRRTAHRLRQALRQDGFVLLYQPQVDLKSGLMRGAEAMLRLQHRRRGLILPQHFMPIAEQSEVVNEIGAWVLSTACQEASSWPARLCVAISLSPRQLQNSRLIKTFITLLSSTGLEPDRIDIQMTEAVITGHHDDTVFNLKALAGLGLRLTVDHFGSGYASLSALKRLPVGTLKLDRSMIQPLGADESDTALVRAAIEAGHALGWKILANGVESETQCRILEELDCDEAQGSYFSQPVPAADFLAKLNPG